MLSWHSLLLSGCYICTNIYIWILCICDLYYSKALSTSSTQAQNVQTQTKHDTEAIYRIVNNQIKITNQFKRDRCVLQYLSIFIYFLGPLLYSFTISWLDICLTYFVFLVNQTLREMNIKAITSIPLFRVFLSFLQIFKL